MQLSHKIRLYPTPTQEAFLRRTCGAARFAWNWALEMWQRRLDEDKRPTWQGLQGEFTAIKKKSFPWLKETPSSAHNRPFLNVAMAFRRFSQGLSSRPKFKSKREGRDSFYLQNKEVRPFGKSIKIPILGRVKMAEPLRLQGKIMSATVSRRADRWYVSIAVKGDFSRKRAGDGMVGVDVGVKHAAVLSTGEKIEGPKPLKKAIRRLRIRSRRLSRKVKGGKNRDKARRKLARLHERIANIRNDFWHKLSNRLCRENQAVAVERLNVDGLKRSGRLGRALADITFGMLRPMLEYKAELYGSRLEVAERSYPSTRLCSACGLVNAELTLADREWTCACGAAHDRDVNAAQNLAGLLGGG